MVFSWILQRINSKTTAKQFLSVVTKATISQKLDVYVPSGYDIRGIMGRKTGRQRVQNLRQVRVHMFILFRRPPALRFLLFEILLPISAALWFNRCRSDQIVILAWATLSIIWCDVSPIQLSGWFGMNSNAVTNQENI